MNLQNFENFLNDRVLSSITGYRKNLYKVIIKFFQNFDNIIKLMEYLNLK